MPDAVILLTVQFAPSSVVLIMVPDSPTAIILFASKHVKELRTPP